MVDQNAQDQALIASCIAANQEADILAIEAEWEQIEDPVEGPWDSTAKG